MGSKESRLTSLPAEETAHPQNSAQRRRDSPSQQSRAAALIHRKEAAAEQPCIRDLVLAQHLTFGDE